MGDVMFSEMACGLAWDGWRWKERVCSYELCRMFEKLLVKPMLFLPRNIYRRAGQGCDSCYIQCMYF